MLSAKVRPSRDLRNNYADIVKSLKNNDHIIITNNGVGESVLISIEDYAKYEEYLHRRYIFEELQISKDLPNDHNVELISAADVFARIDSKLEAHEV